MERKNLMIKLLEMLDEKAHEAFRELGIHTMDFSYNQLEALEDMIDKRWPVGHEASPSLLIPFGWYLGRCLIKNIPGAKWFVPDGCDSIHDVTVKINVNKQVYPFVRIVKFWKNREDKMSTMLRMSMYMEEMNMNLDYQRLRANKDGWIQTNYGDMFRMIHVDGESQSVLFDKLKKTFGDGAE